jgi:hypothetical protein
MDAGNCAWRFRPSPLSGRNDCVIYHHHHHHLRSALDVFGIDRRSWVLGPAIAICSNARLDRFLPVCQRRFG